MKRDVKNFIAELHQRGWTSRKCGSGHTKMTHPSGRTVVFPSSPSDHRWIKNKRAEVRRIERAVQ